MNAKDPTPGRRERFKQRARFALEHPRLPFGLALLAMILTAGALGGGWAVDDYFHRAVLLEVSITEDVGPPSSGMFRFLDGDPDRTRRLMDLGIVPWWTYPAIKASFWRPVTELTHRLDYALWPTHASLMHAHSILWFGGFVFLAASLYRRIMGPTWIAGLAALLFAIDDAHGMPVGWLANRNALVAGFFGIAALLAHDHWRRRKSLAGAIGAPLLLMISLLSAEAGIGTVAYFVAYALILEPGRWRKRLATLIPVVSVVWVYRGMWTLLGHGVEGLGLYVDPLAEPLRFLSAAIFRVPVLLLGQWATPPADLAGVLGPDARRWMWLGAIGVCLLLVVVLAPLVRRDRIARFWAIGMLLALAPVTATFPSDRLLLFVGLGAMGLLAQWLAWVFGGVGPIAPEGRWRMPMRTFGVAMVGIHVVLALVLLVARAAESPGPKSLVDRLHLRPPLGEEVVDQTVVVLNAPSTMHAGYLPVLQALEGKPVPSHTRVLAPSRPYVTVHRLDNFTLSIRPGSGYLDFTLDQLFRDTHHPFAVGDRVELSGLTVEITDLTDTGRPAEATFRFDVELEHPSLRWFCWNRDAQPGDFLDGAFEPCSPPPVGQTVTLK